MSAADGRTPYVGLRSYSAEDRDLFFGRDPESYDVSALWSSTRLLVLYGASGVGKTSLVNAGVIPNFDRISADILPVGYVSQTSTVPTAALPEHNPYTFALLSSWSPNDSPTKLSGLSIAGFLLRRRRLTDRYGDPLPLLAAVDRFEQIFRDFPHRHRYRDQFIRHLADAIRLVPDLRLLISIREDWLASFLPYEPVLSVDSRTRFHLLPLRPQAAVAAVTRPLEGTGRSFASGVAERIVTDLRTIEIINSVGQITKVVVDTVEPTQLQVVCSALWDSLPDDASIIITAHLQSRGDVDRILSDFCARAVAEVSQAHGVPETVLRKWLERTFITDLGTRNTVYEGISLTAGMDNAVARAFEERRILKSEWRSSTRWYELPHDRWIESIRAGNRLPALADSEVRSGDAADYLRTAEGALGEGEFGLAQKHAEEALRLADTDPRTQAEAESLLGNVAFQNGRYREAEEHYRRAAERFVLLQDDSAVGLLLAAIGRLLLRAGNAAEAVRELQRAVERLRGDRGVRIELARALWHTGQLRAAAGVYGNVLESDPESTDALTERAQVNAELGEFAAALDDLDNAARLNPESAAAGEARSARALALAQVGRLREAEVEAEAALSAAPDSGPVLARAASVSARAGHVGEAIELVGRALIASGTAMLPHQVAAARRLLAGLGGG